jgi:2-succinyl-6-hydroxy-2,4-cyclohexadiene-1-carboxylate synthase
MMVLLHGLLGAPASFDAFVEALPSETAVHRPALPGHAGSPAPTADFGGVVDELACAIERAVGASSFDVLGYSLGARLALGLCVRHPLRVRRALLVSVHPGLATEDERRARRIEDERWARLAEDEGLPALVEAWERRPLFATQQALAAGLLAHQRRIRLCHDRAGIAAAIRGLGLGAMPDYGRALDALADRAALVAGARDDKFATLAHARRLPCALMADVGHNPLIEAPYALATLATRFFKEDAP